MKTILLLLLSTFGAQAASLVWNADTNATGFVVEQWTGSNWVSFGTSPTNSITITNTRSAYRVAATNDVGQSDWSVKPASPQNLRVTLNLESAPGISGPWTNLQSFGEVPLPATNEMLFVRARLDWREDP